MAFRCAQRAIACLIVAGTYNSVFVGAVESNERVAEGTFVAALGIMVQSV